MTTYIKLKMLRYLSNVLCGLHMTYPFQSKGQIISKINVIEVILYLIKNLCLPNVSIQSEKIQDISL